VVAHIPTGDVPAGTTGVTTAKENAVKKVFEILDKDLIAAILNTAEYGVLALCGEKPYAVPVNFVYVDDAVYFHGSPKGKKMSLLKENSNVSFNVTLDAAIIPSNFSSTEELACPATSFFKSVIIDGRAEIVACRGELAKAFSAMMSKLQPEGKYTSFDSGDYDRQFAALSMVRINTEAMSAKFKFGQNLNERRFQMVIDHLEKRGRDIDLLTADSMKQFRSSKTDGER